MPIEVSQEIFERVRAAPPERRLGEMTPSEVPAQELKI